MRKQNTILKLATKLLLVFSFNVFADENCAQLSDGVNFSIEGQAKYYCFDSKIKNIRFAYHYANLVMDENRLEISTSGEGTLFNVLIELDDGKHIDATFVTVKSPLIRQVINADGDSKTVEITRIGK